ncbi:MAG TPA: sodium:solute symporter family protein [Prolixibacteraceae bacterium]|nr:sodium:solute symporter family protein [Prolixibacteraceae bacterium]
MKTIILIIYAFVLFLIGIYSFLKIKTPLDYFLAGKKTGVWQISGSLLATILGGSAILGTIGLADIQSWASAWYILAASLGLFGLLPIVRKVYSQGKFTLPELMGQYYGESARKVTSLIIPVAWLGIVAAQIIAGAQIMVSFFQMSYSSGVFLTGIIFIIYTYIGGQVSIMKTDLFQAFFILAGVVLTAVLIPANQTPALPDFGSDFPFNAHFSPFDLFILILTFSSTFVVGPDIYSRVFCAKDSKTAFRSVLIVASILIPFAFVLSYVGIYAATFHSGAQNSSALVNLANTILPEWAAGLLIAALISAVLSTASTTLLTSSMILSELLHKDINNQKSFRQTKFFIIGIGVLSMIISLKVTSIVSSLLLALSFYSGAFIIPMVAALFNLPFNKRFSIAAMLSGGILALSGKLMMTFHDLEIGQYVLISGFLVNILLLFLPFGRKQELLKRLS